MTALTCNVSLKQKLAGNLNSFDRKSIVNSELKHAAVAIVITNCTQPDFFRAKNGRHGGIG